MDLLKRIGLLILSGLFAFFGFFFGFLRLLQDKDGPHLHYIVQDIVFILCGIIGVIACSRALSKMRKDKIAFLAAQPLPEIISADLSLKSKFIAVVLFIFTISSAYAALNMSPDLKGAMVLLGITFIFGFLTYVFWLQYDRDGETLRLDRTGIRHNWYGCIPWSEIVGMSMQTSIVRGSVINVLYLKVNDIQKYRMKTPWFIRLVSGSRMSLHIPLHLLNVEAKKIEQVGTNLRSLHQPPIVPGWNYSMKESEFKTLLEENKKFKVLEDEMKDFERKFNMDRELTESEITDGNKRMEEILSKRSALMNELLDSSNSKAKKASQSLNNIMLGGIVIISICIYFFYLKAGPTWLFGVVAVMLVILGANFSWKLYKIKKKMSQ